MDLVTLMLGKIGSYTWLFTPLIRGDRSAAAVLAAVKKGLSTYNTTKVTVVGHSLGMSTPFLKEYER
jgi:triacylglycerol esterase/lipase EstA (alpha/beta hydrolase family)